MKYMLIMRSTDEANAAGAEVDFDEIITAMGKYNESLVNAGVLLEAEGLTDASEGFVVEFTDEEPLVTDGPYGETHELFNGFWILQVADRHEAAAWAKKAPLGAGVKLEVRRIAELSEFEEFANNEYIQKEGSWRERRDAK